MSTYGAAPEVIEHVELPWDEYMHFMYLPIIMPDSRISRIPDRLKRLVWPLLIHVFEREGNQWPTKYVYVTARRGFATPGNPLNRPGWHTDGFGTPDINYIWTDAFPTLFAEQGFCGISDDHVTSAQQMEGQVRWGCVKIYEPKTLLRLDASVVHAAPKIPEPGGERGFIKISLSDSRYNLRGNSHNHHFNYDWKMWDRGELRNDPAYAGGDAGPA